MGGAPLVGACVSLGKHLAAETPGPKTRTLVDLTQDIVTEQHRVQGEVATQNAKARYEEGA